MLNTQIGAKKSWNGQYQVNCAVVPTLPTLTFYFGGKAYPLEGRDYILEVQGTCISSFTGMDINLPGGSLWIVGECCISTTFGFLSNCWHQVTFSFASTTLFMISSRVLLDLLLLSNIHFNIVISYIKIACDICDSILAPCST